MAKLANIENYYSYNFNDYRGHDAIYDQLEEVIDQQQKILDRIKKARKRMVKMLKKGETGTKISIVYFNTLSETKNLMLHNVNIIKAQRDFIKATYK